MSRKKQNSMPMEIEIENCIKLCMLITCLNYSLYRAAINIHLSYLPKTATITVWMRSSRVLRASDDHTSEISGSVNNRRSLGLLRPCRFLQCSCYSAVSYPVTFLARWAAHRAWDRQFLGLAPPWVHLYSDLTVLSAFVYKNVHLPTPWPYPV
jgi:hypothetical protein